MNDNLKNNILITENIKQKRLTILDYFDAYICHHYQLKVDNDDKHMHRNTPELLVLFVWYFRVSRFHFLRLSFILYVKNYTVCYHHVTYPFQSESTLYSCLNVKELVARNRRDIWILSDSNGIRTHNQLVYFILKVYFYFKTLCFVSVKVNKS